MPPISAALRASWSRRQLVDAMLYKLYAGVPWTELPRGFASGDTVWGYFRRWRSDGTWGRIAEALQTGGEKPRPLAGSAEKRRIGASERGSVGELLAELLATPRRGGTEGARTGRPSRWRGSCRTGATA